ncbi:alpha/beta fold hydrolase [Luteimicrobium sp. DT211]|uniref:alpha/beta fold hydrolase n=1 Tax=Luteimicrobium sp. DT211 TaxID=3393412 RepID=UPI003CF14BDF
MKSISVPTDDGVTLHVATCGTGPDVVVLSGGPGCVHYLADEALAPTGFRCWFPDPRGVGRSGGGPHAMARAVADLESVRRATGAEDWIVLGHSWGSDLAVRYALDHPGRVRGVVGIAGHGLHRDREWSAAYEAGRATEEPVPIDWVPEVHASLWDDFKVWIHEPTLWRRLADAAVPMAFLAAESDIRPSWPLRQLAELVPRGTFEVVDGVAHDFWATDPHRWRSLCTEACLRQASRA